MATPTTAAGGTSTGTDWLSTIANVAGQAYSSYNALEAAKLQAKAGQIIQSAPPPAAPQFTPTVIQLPPQQVAAVAPAGGAGFGGMSSQTLILIAVAGLAAVMLLR